MKQHYFMPNYFLHTEPDTNGNYCLHVDNCSLLQNETQFALLGNFNKLEEVINVTKSSDYSVSLCKECIDCQFSKSANNNTISILVRLKNLLKKRR